VVLSRARMDGPRRGGVSEDAPTPPLALFSFIHLDLSTVRVQGDSTPLTA